MGNKNSPVPPPVADESNENVGSNEDSTLIANAEGRIGELPTVDNETGVNADLNGRPQVVVLARNFVIYERHLTREEMRYYLGRLRHLATEAFPSRVERDFNGNLPANVSPEEALALNESEMARREVLRCIGDIHVALQQGERNVAARQQRAEPYAASFDAQSQTGPNQPASVSIETDESKSSSNVTSEPSTRNFTTHSFECREKESAPDLPSVADESNVNVSSNESSTLIANAEGRREELPTVDSDIGVDTDLNGSPTQSANAEETPEQPTHDYLREMRLWLSQTRELLLRLQASLAVECDIPRYQTNCRGNSIRIINSRETIIHSEHLLMCEEILERFQQMHGRLQRMAPEEARRQRVEPNAASYNVQLQTGLNQTAYDSSETNESKYLSNSTSEPSTRYITDDDSLRCHQNKQPIDDNGLDIGTSAYNFAQEPRSQLDLHMQLSQNEENPHVMTEHTLQPSVPSTSTETQSDASAARASGSVQWKRESPESSRCLQRNPVNEQLQEKQTPDPCSSSAVSPERRSDSNGCIRPTAVTGEISFSESVDDTNVKNSNKNLPGICNSRQ